MRMSVNSNPFEGSFARSEVDMVTNIMNGKNARGSTLRDSEGNSINIKASVDSAEKEVIVSDLDDLEADENESLEQHEVIEECEEEYESNAS